MIIIQTIFRIFFSMSPTTEYKSERTKVGKNFKCVHVLSYLFSLLTCLSDFFSIKPRELRVEEQA